MGDKNGKERAPGAERRLKLTATFVVYLADRTLNPERRPQIYSSSFQTLSSLPSLNSHVLLKAIFSDARSFAFSMPAR